MGSLRKRDSTTWLLVSFAGKLLNQRQKKFSVLAIAFQTILNFLDLLGILLFALLGVLAVSGITYQKNSKNLDAVLNILNLENSSLQIQVMTLAALSLLLLVLRSILSVVFFNRFNIFLARLSAIYISQQLSKLACSSMDTLNLYNIQTWFLILVKGSQSVIIRALGSIVGILVDGGLLVFIFIGLLLYNWKVGLSITLYFGLLVLLVDRIGNSRIGKLSARELNLEQRSNTQINDLLSIFREILVNGNATSQVKKIYEQKYEQAQVQAKVAFMPLMNKYLYESALVASLLVFSGVMFLFFDISTAFGAITLFFAASSRVMPTFLRIQTQISVIRNSKALLQLVIKADQELFEANKKVLILKSHESGGKNESRVQTIKLRKLRISNPVLDIEVKSAIFESGKIYGIVGESGSGKSTFIDVLLGLKECESGGIFFNERNLEPSLMRRRGVFGLVPQEVFLLNNSLRENLLLGRRDIDDKRLIQILQKCNLFNLNNSKINLNEILGFGGRLLSGGEKQRLGLARALLGNPEVLILDESTSALDESSKSVFMNLIENLKKERIIIMVSHDNSLKRYFDEVYELSNGSIHRVESIG